MFKVVRFFKNVTILIFLVILGFSYYQLADYTAPVDIYRSEEGLTLFSVSSDTYFYAAGLFVVISNVLLSTLVRVFRQFPVQKLKIPHHDFWNRDADRREKFKDVIGTWIYTLAILLNVFIMALCIQIWILNRGEGGQSWQYGLFILAFFLVFFLWLGFIFYRLRLPREEFFTSSE